MRTYSFAPISARDYPTVRILDHPHIWGGVRFCVNVSEKPYSPELEKAMEERGIGWLHCPLSEDPPAWRDWEDPVLRAVRALIEACHDGKKVVVHCDFGNNRSRTLVEALYYVLRGEQLRDEYKGEINHLAYNCKEGHLPPIDEMENILDSLRRPSAEQG